MIKSHCFVLLFIVFLFTFSCSEDTVTAPNTYDFNGDFEEHVNVYNTTFSWYPTIAQQTEQNVDFGWNSDEKHSGEYAVSIHIKEDYPTDFPGFYNWTKLYEPFVVNKSYLLKGWIKTQNIQLSPAIIIQCFSSDRQLVGYCTTFVDYPIVGTNDWTEVRINFIPPVNTYIVQVRLGISATDNIGGTVWFDDITIEENSL